MDHPLSTGHPKGWNALSDLWPYHHTKCFQGRRPVSKKRKLFPGKYLVSPRSLVLPPVLYQNAGILTCFPFNARNNLDGHKCPIAPFSKLIYALGSINPRPTAVLVEPFSTSALRHFSLVFATTTKICTRGCYTPGHPKSFLATSTFAYSLVHTRMTNIHGLTVTFQERVSAPSIFRADPFGR